MAGEIPGQMTEAELAIAMGDMHGEIPHKKTDFKKKPNPQSSPPEVKITDWTADDELLFRIALNMGNIHGEAP
jgi:fructose/tagatose bisphosphate aldolase